MKSKLYLVLIASSWLLACNKSAPQLPYLSKEAVKKTMEGKEVIDSVPKTIPPFAFLSQDSVMITEKTVAGKIYIADFFFTSCESICPIMGRNLIKVYEKYKDDPNFMILSHSIDPETDTVAELKKYANKLGVSSKTWVFMTGDEDTIYNLAENHYLSFIEKPKDPEDELIHSGYLLLVDTQRHIRGVYDGTNEKDVDRLLKDIEILKKEE